MMIASRNLKVRNSDGEVELPISVFAPEQHDDGAWSCRYEIGWPEGTKTASAWGADGVQALLIAFSMIGTELYSSSYHKSGQLMLGALGNGYGFPVPASLRHLLEGDDAKYF
jgi:hypothetical protein